MLKEATATVGRLRKAEHAASGDLAALRARADALAETVTRGADASAVLLAQPPRFDGVLGPLASLLTVADGAQEAIAAALGAAAGAVAVGSLDAAVAILAALRAQDAGQAGLVIAGGVIAGGSSRAARPARGSRPPGRCRSGPGPGHRRRRTWPAAVAALLAGIAVADDLAAGLKLIRDQPALRVVTRDGDLLGAHWAHGGSAGGQSLLSLKAAAGQASADLTQAAERGREAESQLATAIEDEDQARQELADAQAAMAEVDAAASQVSGQLGTLAGAARAARDEASRLAAGIGRAEQARAAEPGRRRRPAGPAGRARRPRPPSPPRRRWHR